MHFKGLIAFHAFILFCFFTAGEGCSKDELTTARGLVVNNGTFASGGCETILVIGFALYQPDNLPPQFNVQAGDTLPVEVTYRLVRSAVDCPPTQHYSGVIHLNRIKQI